MVRDITIGQYLPVNSILHKLDPRFKLAAMFITIIMIFCTFNYASLLVVTIFAFSVVKLSNIPLKTYFKGLKVILIVIALTTILNLFYGSGSALFELGIIKITKNGLNSSIFIAFRLIDLSLISSAVMFSTLPTDLTDALERIMKPLKLFKVDTAELAMMMTICLRFIPTLLEETDKITDAQKSRGADIESGNLIKYIKSLIPILVPLFVSSLKRAYDLAIAMECRCYQGGKNRTKMKVLQMQKRDFISIGIFSLLFMLVIFLDIFLKKTPM